MSDFERGVWTAIGATSALTTLVLLIAGSDDWLDGAVMSLLIAYIVVLGKQARTDRGGRA